MENTKQYRVLEIFFRGLRGEDLSVQELANEYNLSTKSITRSINELKNFLADHRNLVGNTEFQYSHQDMCVQNAEEVSEVRQSLCFKHQENAPKQQMAIILGTRNLK